ARATVVDRGAERLPSLGVMKDRGVVMIPPKYFGIWEKALKETFVGYEDQLGIKYLKVSGSAELQELINRGHGKYFRYSE
ncbi:hypothetical protein ACLBPA_29355, partial [Klebsiella pneumoniae]|uniref:hypothetical protein n=1 Tax=Klebsiella pneumoniae TaxID=573 RepID=UPI00396920F6